MHLRMENHPAVTQQSASHRLCRPRGSVPFFQYDSGSAVEVQAPSPNRAPLGPFSRRCPPAPLYKDLQIAQTVFLHMHISNGTYLMWPGD